MPTFNDNYMITVKGRKQRTKTTSGRAIGFDYSALENLIKQVEDLEGNLDVAIEQALKESQEEVTKGLKEEMKRHNRTGKTVESLVENPDVRKKGIKSYEIDVGFDISNGGLPSIFLMYGTPKMEKDTKLFSALYGKKTREKIIKIQEEVFMRYIAKLYGGN